MFDDVSAGLGGVGSGRVELGEWLGFGCGRSALGQRVVWCAPSRQPSIDIFDVTKGA